MTYNQEPQNIQKIFENVRAEGNITVGNITQIYQTVNNLGDILKPTGFPQNIPNSSTDKFVGRERNLELVHQQLQRNHEVVIAAVEGMGGVGKTELAIQYSLLHLQLQNYSGGICWLRAREQDIGLQIVSFARTNLGLNPPEDLDLVERVSWCWKRWREGKTLIVLDDVTNYGDIKSYLPPQPSQFKVLITTRLKLDLADSFYLGVLQEADALQLLIQLVGEEKVNKELEKAKELCQRLGNLPLALQLVGFYVKKRKISLAEILQRLEKKGLGHPSLVVKENDPTWTSDIKNGVAAAFELSWLELSTFTQKLGCYLSLFALAPIPWNLLEKVEINLDKEKLEDARIELEDLHLIQNKDSYITLHTLTRKFFYTKLGNEKYETLLKQAFFISFVEIADNIPSSFTLISKELTHEDIELIKYAIPHLEEAVKNKYVYIKDENLISLFHGLGRFYQEQSSLEPAEYWYKQCVSVVQKRLGEENIYFAASLNGLGRFYLFQVKYSESETILKKALELRQRFLGEEHPDFVDSQHLLGVAYRLQGKFPEAEKLLLEALDSRKRLFGEESLHVADSLLTLEVIYRLQGNLSKAEEFILKALDLKKRFLGNEHLDVAHCLNSLGAVYRHQGCLDQAEKLHLESLALYKKKFGKEYPISAIIGTMLHLAELYKVQQNFSKAEDLIVEILEQQKLLFGEKNTFVILNSGKLAEIYRLQNKVREAESLFIKTIESFKYLPENEINDKKKIQIKLNLVKLYRHQKRYEDEESILLQVLKQQKRNLGENHRYVFNTKKRLAQIQQIPRK